MSSFSPISPFLLDPEAIILSEVLALEGIWLLRDRTLGGWGRCTATGLRKNSRGAGKKPAKAKPSSRSSQHPLPAARKELVVHWLRRCGAGLRLARRCRSPRSPPRSAGTPAVGFAGLVAAASWRGRCRALQVTGAKRGPLRPRGE